MTEQQIDGELSVLGGLFGHGLSSGASKSNRSTASATPPVSYR